MTRRAERAQQPADLATDRAKADDRDSAGGGRRQLRCESTVPRVPLLIGKHDRDTPLHGQEERDRVHRHRGRESVAGVAERDVRRHAKSFSVVVTGGEKLNPAQIW